MVPPVFDASVWANIEPLIAELKSRPVSSADELVGWILDRSELDAACSEARANLYIATSCDTEDRAAADRFTAFLEEVGPRLEVASFELDQKQVDLTGRFPLDEARYGVLTRGKRAAVELFREENVPIQTELAKLSQEYGKVAGAQTVEFDGRERTLAEMSVYLLSAQRGVREGAWRAIAARRLADRAELDRLLDEMIERRSRLAANAGLPGYVEYAFKEKQRFDYGPADCRAFWEGVERHVVPLVRRLDADRAKVMRVGTLRPWDLSCDPRGRPGLAPFKGGRELLEKSTRVMEALDPRLGAMMHRLGEGAQTWTGEGLVTPSLDLDSRKGKRPGGYQYVRDRSRAPFIFMNAAGLHRDVMTMVHEAGHAFHSILAEGDPLVDYRHSPIEFAEVASMSMEHLTMAHWGVTGGFYADEADLNRARREHLEDSITILCWIATIDAFQHWMYEHPGHTHAERDAFWVELDVRFGRGVSWSGLEQERMTQWQRQGHLFSHPMYYIEYGIAQLGALQLWLTGVEKGEAAAVEAYLRALRLGGSKPLPELFKAAGLSTDFGPKTVGRVAEAVWKKLEQFGQAGTHLGA